MIKTVKRVYGSAMNMADFLYDIMEKNGRGVSEIQTFIKYIGIGLALFIGLSVLGFFGFNPWRLLIESFMWMTTYVLPWIFLYFLIQFYKTYEQRQ